MTFTIPLWLLILLSIFGCAALIALSFFAWIGWQLGRMFSRGVWR